MMLIRIIRSLLWMLSLILSLPCFIDFLLAIKKGFSKHADSGSVCSFLLDTLFPFAKTERRQKITGAVLIVVAVFTLLLNPSVLYTLGIEDVGLQAGNANYIVEATRISNGNKYYLDAEIYVSSGISLKTVTWKNNEVITFDQKQIGLKEKVICEINGYDYEIVLTNSRVGNFQHNHFANATSWLLFAELIFCSCLLFKKASPLTYKIISTCREIVERSETYGNSCWDEFSLHKTAKTANKDKLINDPNGEELILLSNDILVQQCVSLFRKWYFLPSDYITNSHHPNENLFRIFHCASTNAFLSVNKRLDSSFDVSDEQIKEAETKLKALAWDKRWLDGIKIDISIVEDLIYPRNSLTDDDENQE